MAVYKDKNKTKDGRAWYFKVYKDKKAYKSKRYLTKTEAKEEEALFLLKRDNPHRKPFVLIAKDYFDNLSQVRKESTMFSYKNLYHKNIKPYFEEKAINEIKIEDIRKWKELLQAKKLKITYLNKCYNLLKGEITQKDLLNYYNATITYEELPKNIKGYVFTYNGINNIMINKNLSYYKKKKTILHELAHIELNQLCQYDKDLFALNIEKYEDEADRYIKFLMEEI